MDKILVEVDYINKKVTNYCSNDNLKNFESIVHGSIYNLIELQQLIDESLNSISEIITRGFQKFGVDFVKHVKGTFLIIFINKKEEEILVFRDRVGLNQVYYTVNDKMFLCSNNVKELVNFSGMKVEILEQSIYDYLTYLTVPAPATMFKDVFKLEAGSYIHVKANGNLNIKKYWDIKDYLNTNVETTIEKAIESTRCLLEKSIINNLNFNGKEFIALSSGVDSSLLTAISAQNTKKVEAITIDYEITSKFSESTGAENISKELGVFNLFKENISTNDFSKHLQNYYLEKNDYPIGSPDSILINILSEKIASLDGTTCLSGEGADEIGGYQSYIDMVSENEDLELFNRKNNIEKERIFQNLDCETKEKYHIALGKYIIPRRHIQAFSENEKKQIWNGEKTLSSYRIMENLMDEIYCECDDLYLRQVSNIEFKLRLPEFLLNRIASSTELSNIQVKLPFLDNDLVEYSAKLNYKLKLKDGIPKYIIKSLLEPHLDMRYIYKEKIGFGKVLSPFLNDILPIWLNEQILINSNHPIFKYIKKDFIKELYEKQLETKSNGFKIWNIYSLAKWLEIYN